MDRIDRSVQRNALLSSLADYRALFIKIFLLTKRRAGQTKGESAGWVPQHLSTWSVLEQFSGTCRVPRYLEVLRYLPGTTAFQGTRRVSAHEVYAKD